MPHRPPLLQRACASLESVGRSTPWVREVALHPLVARAGYWMATGAGLAWGAALSVGRFEQRQGVWVAGGCPHWSFARGGTTIGAVYLTDGNTHPDVLDHEAVHRAQWRRYGLCFIVLYAAAGADATSNRFEIEAGLERGGYR